MPQNETRDWTFRLRVDQQSTQQSSTAVKQLRDRIDGLREETKQLRVDAERLRKEWQAFSGATKASGADLSRAENSARSLSDELERVDQSVARVDRSFRSADGVDVFEQRIKQARSQADVYGDVASRTTALSGLASSLGGSAVGSRLMIASDILDATEAAKRMRAELPKLVDQMGGFTTAVGTLAGVGGALVLGTLVLKGFNDEQADFRRRMEESRQAARDFYNLQGDFINFITTATQEDKQQQLQTLNDDKARAEANLHSVQADIQALAPLIQEALAKGIGPDAIKKIDLTLPSGKLIQSGTDLFQTYQELLDQEKQYREALRTNSLQIQKTADVMLESGNTLSTAGDAVVTAFEGVFGVFNVFSQTVLPEMEKRLDHASRTAEGSSSRLAQGLAGFSASYGGGGSVAALAAQSQAEKEKTLADAIDAANQYLDEQADTEAKRTLTLSRDQADADRKRARDVAAHNAELAQLDADYYGKVNDQLTRMAEDATAEQKQQLDELVTFNRESERQAEDHNDRMLDIERSLNRGVEGAVEDRSVSAAIEAVRSARQQAEDEQDQYAKEQARRDEDFQLRLDELDDQRDAKLKAGRQTLADLKQQHDRERTANVQAFNQRLREEDQERQIRLTRQRQDWAAEDLERNKHFTAQLSHTATHWGQVQTLTETGMANMRTKITEGLSGITSGLSSFLKPATSAPLSSVGAIFGGLKSYAAGSNRVAVGELVRVGDDANRFELAQFNRDGSWQIFNNRQSREILSGSQPVSISLSMPIQTAMSGQEIEAVVRERVIPKIVQAVQQVSRQTGVR